MTKRKPQNVDPLKFYALSPRYQHIVRLRLGLDGKPRHTFDQIAAKLGCSRQRAWVLYHRALEKMKEAE